VSAVPSAILMSSQPLWVAVIAVVWFHERVGWSMVVGGGMMAAAMLLALPARSAVLEKEDKRRKELLAVSRVAAAALANLRIKREDPLGLTGEPAPYLDKSACANTGTCPWHTRSLKGGGEPSLERLIERATVIVRARGMAGPGCCQSVTLLGRCLCDLMEESERRRRAALPRWFQSK
jgi:hypothetical protein